MSGQFFVLFAILFTGYFLRKSKFIDGKMNEGVNKFVCYFAYPCLLVKNIGSLSMNGTLVREFLLMAGLTAVLYVIYSAYAYFYAKARHFPKRISNVAELAMASSNDGFMGFPITLIFFGEKGLFLMMAHNVALNTFYFTYGLIVLRRNNEGKNKSGAKEVLSIIGKVLLNPNILGIVLGFVLTFAGVSLDNAFGSYLSLMGNVATPMAMIFIGSTLAESNFIEMFRNRIVWEASINKLIILPLITALAVWFLPVSPMIKATLILGCCFPAGATVSMLAQQEKQNEEMASKILFLTTMASIVTIPLSMYMVNLWLL
ncbi:MAG: AEC family transporter [Anaerovoracaceae bacterium]